MPETKTTTPSLGVGYYPERVDETRWPEDLRMMRSIRIKFAHVAINKYRKQCPRRPKCEVSAQYFVESIERRIAPIPW